ncbi:MAG TPA: DUF1614 domain-containing protein, partial [Candidatus Thermoplasmatota archaeon]|nr:DUF1614 domain-containing protein [Candidatus Thermoplasmatota archaeon]
MAEPASDVTAFFLTLAGIALAVLLLYLLYSGIVRAFSSVGFSRGEVTFIVLGSILGGLINIPLFASNGWLLAINVGGAVVPVVVAILLMRRFPGLLQEALVAITFVAIAAYLVTDVTPEGVTSPFPLFLIPVAVASIFSLLAFWRDAAHSAPLAYIGGTLGVLIGADLVRIPEILAQPVPAEGAIASIGGASIYDMVFLTGVFAVLLDVLLFQRRIKEEPEGLRTFQEAEVFTPSTPYEVLNGPVRLPAT